MEYNVDVKDDDFVPTKILTVLGPTASGKTKLAVAVASKVEAEIISADSRQIYRCMDIGTGKDLGEYHTPNGRIPHHLIDIVEPGTHYNVFQYLQDFRKVYNKLQIKKKPIILCGGSGLYLEAVLKGYDLPAVSEDFELRKSLENKTIEELSLILEDLKKARGTALHNKTDTDNPRRAIRAIEIETHLKQTISHNRKINPIPSVIIGLTLERQERRQRITERLKKRLNDGLIEEIKALLDRDISPKNLMYYGLEYRYVTEYVIGEISKNEMFERLEIAIHQFAKRQMTWFRGMERRGFTINWLDATLPFNMMVDKILDLWKSN